ncbi:MAG: YkgJ family cysteine cluster protein [Armatimonadota bacterium]
MMIEGLSVFRETAGREVYQEACVILGKITNLPRVLEVERMAQSYIDNFIKDSRDRGLLFDVKCQKGCAWCCHTQVSLLPSTVFHIIDYLETRPRKVVAALKQRTNERYQQKKNMTPRECEDAIMACPFLVNQACLIYPARPFQCRGQFSNRPDICSAANEICDDPPDLQLIAEPQQVGVGAEEGVLHALRQAGIFVEQLELVSAMHVAFTEKNIAVRWLSGIDVFDEAKLTRWHETLMSIGPDGRPILTPSPTQTPGSQ